MALLGCNNTEPVMRCTDCSDEKSNRILHTAYVKRTVTIPTTSIISSLLAAELAGNAYIDRNVNGEYDGGTFSDRTGRGKQDTQNGSAVHNVVYTSFTPVTNRPFHNDFKDVASNYYMIFFTDGLAHYADSPLRFMPSAPITRDLNTFLETNITVRWTNKDLPDVYSVDETLLEACPNLFTFDEDNLFPQSGSDGTLVGDTVTIDVNDGLDIRYDAFTALAYAELDADSDELPAGVTISVSGNALIISGTPTETGTFELIVICRNTTGVAGVVTVTLVVV